MRERDSGECPVLSPAPDRLVESRLRHRVWKGKDLPMGQGPWEQDPPPGQGPPQPPGPSHLTLPRPLALVLQD